MDVKVTVQAGDQVMEEYIVPPGTWLQSRYVGAIPINATHVTEQFSMGRCSWQGSTVRPTITLTPIDPPSIPEALLKLVTGRDERWGREGIEWMGVERDSGGGTPLRRAQAYGWRYARGWFRDAPVELTEAEVDALLEKGTHTPFVRDLAVALRRIESLAEGGPWEEDLAARVARKMDAMSQPNETDAVFAVITDVAAEALGKV